MNTNVAIQIKHPTKRAIIQYLKKHKTSYLGEILKSLSLSYSKGYKYMEELKSEGLVENRLSPPKYNLVE